MDLSGCRYNSPVDRPLADVVSFPQRSRTRPQGDATAPTNAPDPAAAAAGAQATDGPAVREPDYIAREAMYWRLAQLARGDPGSAGGSVDDELAVLVYDSAAEQEPLVGIRGEVAASTRQLTFATPSLVIEVQLENPGRELTCQVVPPQPASMEVRHRAGSLDLGNDDFGTFHIEGLPQGAISLRCVPLSGGAEPISTSWIAVSDGSAG